MSIHVAILMRRYVDLILSGKKTVESRLTRSNLAPFQRVQPGDHIWFKVSSGPFMCRATADKVAYYDNLTPARIMKLKEGFNARVCGEDEYWNYKSNALYASFIKLRDVQPVTRGPQMKPSSGLAWFVLDDSCTPPDEHCVLLTAGAIRNGYINVSAIRNLFPADAWGGTSSDEAGQPITIDLPDGKRIETDIVMGKNMLRDRRWRTWFADNRLQPGSVLRIEPVGQRRYRLLIARR